MDKDTTETGTKRGRGRPRTAHEGAKPVSLYMDEDTLGLLEQRGKSRSEILRSLVARYDEIMRRSLPDMPRDVWLAVVNTFAGSSAGSSMASPVDPDEGFRHEGVQRILVNSVGSALEDMVPDEVLHRVVGHLNALDDVQTAAVLDLNDRFWAGDPEAQVFIRDLP